MKEFWTREVGVHSPYLSFFLDFVSLTFPWDRLSSSSVSGSSNLFNSCKWMTKGIRIRATIMLQNLNDTSFLQPECENEWNFAKQSTVNESADIPQGAWYTWFHWLTASHQGLVLTYPWSGTWTPHCSYLWQVQIVPTLKINPS